MPIFTTRFLEFNIHGPPGSPGSGCDSNLDSLHLYIGHIRTNKAMIFHFPIQQKRQFAATCTRPHTYRLSSHIHLYAINMKQTLEQLTAHVRYESDVHGYDRETLGAGAVQIFTIIFRL